MPKTPCLSFSRWFHSVWLVSALLANPAFGQPQGHIEVTRYSDSYHVESDGSYVRTEEIEQRALDAQGVEMLGQFLLQDNAGHPAAEVLLAETILESGERITVPSSSIQRQNGILNQTLASSDQNLTRITFPRLSPGASTHFRVKTRIQFPGLRYFAVQDTFPETVAWKDVEVSVDVPGAMVVRFDANGPELVSDQTDWGRRKLRWHWIGPPARLVGQGEVNFNVHAPHVIVTSFPSWKEVGEFYGKNADEKAEVAAEVSKLADQIAAGKTASREIAEAAYIWVRDNIRYTALWSGMGALVPHDAATVLRNRWGDCKDHATLLQAILKAKGIDSVQALLMADFDTYELPALPSQFAFNHVITYVPSLDLYLDSTASKVPFGLLPESDQNKPVLLTRNFQPMTTGLGGPLLLSVERKTSVDLHQDGSADLRSEISGHGTAAISAREFIDRIGVNQLDAWATQNVASGGHTGTASLSVETRDDPTAYGFVLTEHVSDYLKQPEAAAIRFLPPIEGSVALGWILSRFHDANRLHDFFCVPFKIEDDFEYRLASGVRILYVPPDRTIDDGPVHAVVRYQATDAGIHAHISVRMDSSRFACKPDEYPSIQAAMERVDRAIHAQALIAQGEQTAPTPACVQEAKKPSLRDKRKKG
jgi:hypothetical protein